MKGNGIESKRKVDRISVKFETRKKSDVPVGGFARKERLLLLLLLLGLWLLIRGR